VKCDNVVSLEMRSNLWSRGCVPEHATGEDLRLENHACFVSRDCVSFERIGVSEIPEVQEEGDQRYKKEKGGVAGNEKTPLMYNGSQRNSRENYKKPSLCGVHHHFTGDKQSIVIYVGTGKGKTMFYKEKGSNRCNECEKDEEPSPGETPAVQRIKSHRVSARITRIRMRIAIVFQSRRFAG